MTYYLVLRLQRFDALEFSHNLPFPVAVKTNDGTGFPNHYLPVFETHEEAEEWSDGGRFPIQAIQTIDEAQR